MTMESTEERQGSRSEGGRKKELVPVRNQVVETRAGSLAVARPVSYVPAMLVAAGDSTAKRFLTFFTDNIRNPNTRRAYHRNVCEFFEWAAARGLSFAEIESPHVSLYIEDCLAGLSRPSVKQRLASVRMLYDWLITSGMVPELCGINPASSVRGPKHVVKKGKTKLLSAEETRELLDSIPTAHVVGLRDRALIGLMTYTFARVGAAISMKVEDFYVQGRRSWVHLAEKGVQGCRDALPPQPRGLPGRVHRGGGAGGRTEDAVVSISQRQDGAAH